MWFTATALPKFKEAYGVKKDITSFKEFLKASGGGSRPIRFVPGGPTNRGYCINVEQIPPALVKGFFRMVKKHFH